MSYATIQEVNTSIMFSNFTNEQLNSIVSAVQYARAQLGKEKIREFRKGDTVKFTSVKRGCVMTGTVSKVAIKYVTVATQQGLWKVPANMLEAA
jgi:LPS O-antigen subunit length determinant protein (WzzB/FepE family)